MSKDTKFNEDEMKTVKDIQQRYVDVQHKLGQLSVTRIRIEQQLNALDERENQLSEDFIKTQNDEKQFIGDITKKYGDGVLNPNTGMYNQSIEDSSENKSFI